MDNYLALMKLDDKFLLDDTFSPHIRPICLHTPGTKTDLDLGATHE